MIYNKNSTTVGLDIKFHLGQTQIVLFCYKKMIYNEISIVIIKEGVMETKENIKWDGEFGALERVTFMSDLLNKQVEIRNMLDLRTNIMIGFNSALAVFFAANLQSILNGGIFFIGATISVVVSMGFSLMALKPSHFATKKGQTESLFYHHQICANTEEQYRNQILGVLANEDSIYDNYIKEIYNLTKYSNVPRKFYLNWSIRILLYGVAVSILLYGLSLLPDLIGQYLIY